MCLFCVLIEVCDSLVMLGLSNFIRSVGYYVGGNMVFLDAGYFYHYEKTKKFGISNCKYRDRNLLLAEVRDCTFNGTRNTVVVCFTSLLSIPNRHFIPSSLLFSITNTQFAPISGCFQAHLPPNSHRRLRLRSNNGSGDIRDPVVAKRDLAALGPLFDRADWSVGLMGGIRASLRLLPCNP